MRPPKYAQFIEHWRDERTIGNGIIVTLRKGLYFYDDCGVMSFSTPGEALREVRRVIAESRNPQQ